jgi:hypothetical protein
VIEGRTLKVYARFTTARGAVQSGHVVGAELVPFLGLTALEGAPTQRSLETEPKTCKALPNRFCRTWNRCRVRKLTSLDTDSASPRALERR